MGRRGENLFPHDQPRRLTSALAPLGPFPRLHKSGAEEDFTLNPHKTRDNWDGPREARSEMSYQFPSFFCLFSFYSASLFQPTPGPEPGTSRVFLSP